MNLYDIQQIELLVDFILAHCSYNDLDDLVDQIGIDPEWLAQWGIAPWGCEEEE